MPGLSHAIRLHQRFVTPCRAGRPDWVIPLPRPRNACRLFPRDRFGLFRFRSPLLTESRLLSLPAGTEMFHFPAFPPHALCVQAWVTGHDSCRVSPFGDPRITARLAAPRGLSQPPTSFFGSWCLGIHRAPLVTWPQRCSRVHCAVLKMRAGRPLPPERRSTVRAGCCPHPLPGNSTACPAENSLSASFHAPTSSTKPRGGMFQPNSQRSTHEHRTKWNRPPMGDSSSPRAP